MVYNLTYRRPNHVTSSTHSLSGEEKQRSVDESIKTASSCSMCHGIPDALSFDRIISGGTCPPCTLRDFMNYLKYIEHAAENLQFFLWFRAYEKKFSELPESEKFLSPPWMMSEQEAEALAAQSHPRVMKVSADTAGLMKGTGLERTSRLPEIEKDKAMDPFSTPPRRHSSEDTPRYPESTQESNTDSKPPSNCPTYFKKKAEGAYDEAGLKWQPFTIQPFRDELARVVTIYIADGGPRQLNLSSKERNALLHALENTTHPSAFRGIVTTVQWSLRCQAHPNFIRWTICNGNRPRVLFARGLGIGGVLAGIIVALLITLSGAGRAWRVLSLILFFIGISTLIAAWKGMCVVLHGMHHRHLRPWELFQDEDDATVEMKSASYDSFDSQNSNNSFEDEPWIAKYKKRNIVRKIFDRELWIEEPALRQIQDTIFLQAVLGGLVGGALLTAIFVAVPSGGFF